MQLAHLQSGIIEYRYDKRGDRQHLLLFNGGHTNADMRDSEGYFVEHGYSVLSVHRPGYGKTPSFLAKDFGNFEQLVFELLDRLHIDKTLVLGISAGGRSSMRFAQLYPERVIALILMSSTSFEGWPEPITRLGAYVAFNPVVEEVTWAISRWMLRTFPGPSTRILLLQPY